MAAQDHEGAEKPVREQLKKASIGGMSEEARAATKELGTAGAHSAKHGEGTVAGGGAKMLDSRESDDKPDEAQQKEPVTISGRHHTRKRSRDSTAEDDDLNDHKRKISGERSRAQSPAVESAAVNGAAKHKSSDRSKTPDPTTSKTESAGDDAVVSPKVKRSKIQGEAGSAENDSQSTTEATKIPPGSGFANTSATSPFGSLASNKKPSETADQPQTSTSAFAASGFSSLANSSASPFAAASKSSGGGFGFGSGFGSGSKSPLGGQANDENAKPPGSTFGGSLGQQSAFGAPKSSTSGFGSGASGFGKIGQTSGLGSGLGGSSGFGSGNGGLSSFASGKATPLSGASKAKAAFGAPADDDDDEGDNDGADEDTAGSKSPLAATENDEKDERFFEQDVETGEEDETTAYSCRAKLYNYFTLPDGKKEWRERGLGVLRLNVKPGEAGEEGESSKSKARFLMRADGSHRVVLNTPVKKEIKFGTPSGAPPTNGFMYFLGTFDGRDNLEMLQIKLRQQFALELYEKIVELQKEM